LISSENGKPLQSLRKFAKQHLRDTINTLHILPFFPYSSDRGFSVIDFEEVDPRLGTWADILELKSDFKLMFDGVFNHMSSKSRWFQEFLNGNPEFRDFFIVFSTKQAISEDHLALIVRPRTSDLLSTYDTINGPVSVWTTFSRDQVDLNFKHPSVLLKIVEILLNYIRKGADVVRLDAVTYLWAELGTSCVHLKETHAVIKLFRDILNVVAPKTALITETNVPHEDNIQYFGEGDDEAQMVYNFALPPLVLHSFQQQDASRLTEWAARLEPVSDTATYFNFLDSHDGVGVMGAKGILTDQEIEMMALKVLEHGGFISYKNNGDGTVSPYELNISWFSALNRDDEGESDDLQISRFIASRSIPMVLMGVPGIYLHGLLGSKNDAEAVLEEKHARSINRRTIVEEKLYEELADHGSRTYRISRGISDLLKLRTQQKAFHPNSGQRILDLGSAVFGVVREPARGDAMLCLTNVSALPVEIKIDCHQSALAPDGFDLIGEQNRLAENDILSIRLEPYQVIWRQSRPRPA
jgi:sucrose phosphorylase